MVYQRDILATEMTNDLLPILNSISDKTKMNPTIAYERQNGGLFEMERIASLNRANKFTVFRMPEYGIVGAENSVRYGWDTNTATRPKMLSDLKEAVDKRLLTIYDKQTIDEMFSFVVMKTSSSWKAQAESNAHDDLVMSLAIAWQLYQICPKPNPEMEQEAKSVFNQRLNEDDWG